MIVDFENTDENGNVFVFKKGDFTLKLKSDSYTKKIGKMVEVDGVMKYTKNYDSTKHIYRKDNSLGICNDVLKMLPDSAILRFIEDYEIIREIQVENANKVGSYKFFKQHGFEKQFFIPISEMTTVQE